MKRSLVVFVPVLLVVAAASFGGCGNDFDALFPGDAVATGPEGGVTPGRSDAGEGDGALVPAGDSGSSPGAEAGAVVCAPIVPTCAEQQNCGQNCDNTCVGCGCTCGRFDCDDGDAKSCKTTCSGGATCSVDCDIEGPCTLEANMAASAKLDCSDKATSCTGTCGQGGACEVSCKKGNAPCNLTCGPTSVCTLRCGGATACALDCLGGVKRECPGGVITCNRDCP